MPELKPESQRRVAYLLGAGATQGAVSFAGSTASLIMSGLIDDLLRRMREVYIDGFQSHPGVGHLVNDVVGDDTDFEHLLTFLDDTPSAAYQSLGEQLKAVFSNVLRAGLKRVRDELGENHSALFAVLLDMHQVESVPEVLSGFLTLNYDSFLEHAIECRLGHGVDYGIAVTGGDKPVSIPVLKLHGSFSWRHEWPIAIGGEFEAGLWIPPGIRKAKSEYPFNAIWGAARSLLDCDVLRIIGCNLGPNDWDLVSLLFTTMHGRDTARPYEIEIVGPPDVAARIAEAFPYLSVRSLLELADVGPELIGEVLGVTPKPYSALEPTDQVRALQNVQTKVTNPFEQWLRLKGELMLRDLPTIETEHGLFKAFVESAA